MFFYKWARKGGIMLLKRWNHFCYRTCRPQRRRTRVYFFRRRLRETQPKKRVPRTRFLRFIRRTTLFSERLDVPSRKRTSFAERVRRARWTSPALTLRRRRRRLIETIRRSPGRAVWRLPPPRGRIHSTERAPELSIVVSHVWGWTIFIFKNSTNVKVFFLQNYISR